MARRRCLLLATLLTGLLAVAPPTASAATLYPGMCGPPVFALQVRLAKRAYLPAGYRPGCYDYRTTQAVMAFQGWVGFVRDGVAGPLTQRRLILSVTPRPWSRARKHVEIHKTQQVMLLVSARHTVLRAIHVSTASPGHVTPSGFWKVYSKSPMSWSKPFGVWLPWASYVVGGVAMHSYPDVPGYPASHGCIRIPAPEALFVYNWTPIGTPVRIG
ncbi:MAG: L,D-transpeptidase family protein [Gaiellales bacterium]